MINKRLNPVYGCVQGGHAVAQYMMEHPQEWKNEFLIYLYADTEKWKRILQERGIPYSFFREPDLNNVITAIAVRDDSGEMFKNLKLVKG